MTEAPRELDLIDATAGDEATAARAEERRLAAVQLVNALFRLVRVLGIHNESNQAVHALVDGMAAAVGAFCEVSSSGTASVLFAEDTVFVNGQMLRASKDTYATAIKLGQYYERCGISEITFESGVTRQQVSALARATYRALQGAGAAGSLIDASIGGVRLRKILGTTTQGDGEGEKTLAERTVRTYATSVVVLREFFADLQAGELPAPRRIKRVAQKLVSSADEEARILLALTGARASESDPASLAVNSAILAVLMARGLTPDRTVLAGIATAALMFDVGEPRLSGRSAASLGVRRRLSEAELDRLPASTAAVLTALGRIQTRTIASTVAAWEARWLQRAARLGPPYGGRRLPTLLARVLATARAFTELTGTTAGTAPPAVDDVVQLLTDRATEESERAVVRLLIAALGIFPLGATVELTTGELAMVIGVPDVPLNYPRPLVRLLSDESGNLIESGTDVDLAAPRLSGEPARSVCRVVESDAQQLKEMRAYVMSIVAGRKAKPPAPREVPASRASLPPPRVSKAPPGAGRYSSIPSNAVHAPRTSAPTRQVSLEDYARQTDLTDRGTAPPAQARPTIPPAHSGPAAAPTARLSWENYKEAFAAVQASRLSDPGDPRDSVVGVERKPDAAPPAPPSPAPPSEEAKKASRTRMVRWANTEALFDDLQAEEKAKRGGPKEGDKQ
jgi:hypothetical protein